MSTKQAVSERQPDRATVDQTGLQTSLPDYVASLALNHSSYWAFSNYKSVVTELSRIRHAGTIMEIGAGRSPLFEDGEIARMGVKYILNDISDVELSHSCREAERAHFDIADPDAAEIERLRGQVDLMFSYMVFEHVSDARASYVNIHKLLSPAGICINFHPTLFALPFLINRLLPISASEMLTRRIWKSEEKPKFPAYYDRCWVSRTSRDFLLSLGFSQAWQLPFWHHSYFQFDRWLNTLAERANWTALAAYCFTIVVK